MTIPCIVRRLLTMRRLLLISTVVVFVAAIAQTENGPENSRILVDGAREPDRVPDWILWNEIFQMAVVKNEDSPGKGQELWVEKLHLPRSAMNELIQHGYENRDLQAATKKEASGIISASRGESKDRVRVKLRKTRAYTESRILELRDKLRARIGDEAFLKLQSYARHQIAPDVRIEQIGH